MATPHGVELRVALLVVPAPLFHLKHTNPHTPAYLGKHMASSALTHASPSAHTHISVQLAHAETPSTKFLPERLTVSPDVEDRLLWKKQQMRQPGRLLLLLFFLTLVLLCQCAYVSFVWTPTPHRLLLSLSSKQTGRFLHNAFKTHNSALFPFFLPHPVCTHTLFTCTHSPWEGWSGAGDRLAFCNSSFEKVSGRGGKVEEK